MKIQLIFISLQRKIKKSHEKTNDILLLRNEINFHLVKVIVSKIAYTSLENTKNEHFLTTSHRKVELEIFSESFGLLY